MTAYSQCTVFLVKRPQVLSWIQNLSRFAYVPRFLMLHALTLPAGCPDIAVSENDLRWH